MNKIIQISTLYDKYHEMVFGYVGVDIDTGNIKYFSHYDQKDKYNPCMLYEFDINNCKSQYLRWHLCHCSYERPYFSDDLPKELINSLDNIITKHKLYNEKNNYPINNLEFNKKNLSVQYAYNFSLFGNGNFAARYTPVANIIELTTNEIDWYELSLSDKERVKNSIIHEVGHMKTSKYELNERKNKLFINTGLYSSEITLESYPIYDSGIFYTVQKNLTNNNTELYRNLEEIINEVDCSYAFPQYIGNYPTFGKQLNELCDRRLLTARYNGGIDVYYDSLKSIINSESLATELLEYINESINGINPKDSEEKVYTLLKHYHQKKSKK